MNQVGQFVRRRGKKPAPLEEPQGRRAGPARQTASCPIRLARGSKLGYEALWAEQVMFHRVFAVRRRLDSSLLRGCAIEAQGVADH